jgi:large subunit ribosomal protein L21
VDSAADAVFARNSTRIVAAPRNAATIWSSVSAEKIIVFKFKRKKQYKKTIGHRQSFTEVKVGDILV